MAEYSRAVTTRNRRISSIAHTYAQVQTMLCRNLSDTVQLFLNYILNIYVTGLENRPKDIGRFFFWMTVRGKDLDFLTANLTVEESAFEAEECEGANVPESSYARRKRRTEDSLHQQKVSDKKQQIAIMKEIMSTPENGSTASTTSSDSVNESIVQKNLASANEKKVNNLLKVMDNAIVFALYTVDEQNEMKSNLKFLITNK